MIKHIFFFVLLFIIGCDNNTTTNTYYDSGEILERKTKVNDSTILAQEYYENGNLKIEWNIINEKTHGVVKYFYESGKIEQVDLWNNGLLEGKTQLYYENGEKKEEGFYIQGKQQGWYTYYNLEGRIEAKREYILLDSASYLNQVIYFDSNGDTILDKSSYYTLHSDTDTISLGDNFSLKIKLDAYYYDMMSVTVGNYDSVYNISDTTPVYASAANNHQKIYNHTPLSKGKKTIRGVILDFKIEEKDSTNTPIGRQLFFKKEFYVK